MLTKVSRHTKQKGNGPFVAGHTAPAAQLLRSEGFVSWVADRKAALYLQKGDDDVLLYQRCDEEQNMTDENTREGQPPYSSDHRQTSCSGQPGSG